MELSNLSLNPLCNFWNENGHTITIIITLIGTLKALSLIIRFLCFIWSYYLRPQQNLIKKYGKCWAMITGGSEGIGEAIARELASQGFNILLVSRSREKLEKAVHNILRDFPGVECEFVIFDFNERLVSKEAYEPLIREHEKKDIGIVIQNVGAGEPMILEECGFDQIENVINVNVSSTATVTSIALPYLLSRSHKSLIVYISSLASCFKPPFLTMYSSTKCFVTTFGESLYAEMHASNIDVSVLSPAGVVTRMHPDPMPLDCLLPQIGHSYVKHFGREPSSTGHPKHSIQQLLFSPMPKRFLHPILKQVAKEQQDKYNNHATH